MSQMKIASYSNQTYHFSCGIFLIFCVSHIPQIKVSSRLDITLLYIARRQFFTDSLLNIVLTGKTGGKNMVMKRVLVKTYGNPILITATNGPPPPGNTCWYIYHCIIPYTLHYIILETDHGIIHWTRHCIVP